ncbi:uncharacterized mitochondrial protein-like protein [Tanacetum coccineum]
MPIWKDASYFDSPSKDVGNGEPKSAADDQNLEVNTGHLKLNTIDTSVNTTRSSDPDSPKDMFTMGGSHTLEATHVEFFGDKDELEIDLGNIFNSYTVWKLMELPNGKRAIRTKWVFKYKKDERGIVIRNKARLVAHSHRQEEGIDYEEVFAFVARIEAIRLFLAYASFMGFLVYQMDVKSAFLYGTIEEEVYVTQLPGFKDPDYPDKVTQKEDGIFINQDKYVAEILKKFNYTDVKSASTPVDLEKALVKDGDADDVDVHLYRSMIGSLMYLTASRPDIMFVVSACARFQVTPKTSHLLAVKRIFRYLKGKPTLGLWYSRDSPFELIAYTDSDYAGATQDRKSTTGGCQFLGNRLISWQCKKQTVVATSTTKAEYVAAASCCGQIFLQKVLMLEDAQTRFETTSKQSNDPPLSRVNTLRIGEDSMKLMELMAQYTTLTELQTAALSTTEDGVRGITATIDRKVKVFVSEASIRRHIKLEDSDGISQARRRAKVVISDAEEDEEDPSKQERSLIEELDLDAGISLVPPHAADQGRINDTQISDKPEEQLVIFSAATALADAARRR